MASVGSQSHIIADGSQDRQAVVPEMRGQGHAASDRQDSSSAKGEALYLKTLDQLICLKQDFEELRSKYETLEAKHTNFVFYSTPSAVVEDLQEQVDTLTAKVDKRAGKYLEKKLRCRCLTNMTTDLRTHNTSLTQEVSGLRQTMEDLERRLAVAERKESFDDESVDSEANAADISSSETESAPTKSPTAASLPAFTSRTSKSGSETSSGTLFRVDSADGALDTTRSVSPKAEPLQNRGQGPKKDRSLHGLCQMRTGFGIESLYARGGVLAELDDSSRPTPLPASSEANLQVKVKDPQDEPSQELSMPEAASNTQLAAQANAANTADISSSQTESAPTKSPIAASLPALTSNSGYETSTSTLSRVDIADKALGTTRFVSPKAADTKLQTRGQGPKKDRSLRGLRQMRTGFGIESLYAPGGMLAELARSSSPTPLPATAKLTAAMTLPEECGVAAADATTTVQVSIAMAGQATGRTILPGPQSATLGECLEDWCLSRGLCEDDLAVYHFRKVVDRKVWGQTFEELAWGSEVHLQVKVQNGLTETTQGAETHMQLPLSCCTNQDHLQAVNSVPMSGPDSAEYQGQSTAAQSANGKPLSTLLKHSPTCSSGTRAEASKPCTPLLGPSAQSALPMSKRSPAEPIAAGSALSSRSSHSMCEALPGTPTRADLMTPAKGMGGSHTSTSSQQSWSSATSTSAGSGYPFTSSPLAASQPLTCKTTLGPSAGLQARLTRLAVPSLLDVNSPRLACVSTPATFAASNGSKTPAAANQTTTVPSPAHMLPSETGQTLKHHTPSPSPACLVRPARRSSGISSISSRPEWSSAYSCTSAAHPSPMQRSSRCFSKQPMTPISTAGTQSPAPAATATRSRRLSPTLAATPAVRSREAMRLPAGRSSSLAARLASTARTAPVSRPEANDHVAAARADEPTSTCPGATRPAAAAAPADSTYGSTTGRSRATASKPNMVQPAARAAAKATANRGIAAERKSAQPRRSGRQGSICTRPAPQPTADIKIATRFDSVQVRRSARQSSILARSAVCPTAPPPAAHTTAPPAAASLRATAATAEPHSSQLRRSARHSSLPYRPHTRASTNINAFKPGNAQTAGPASQGNPTAGRLPNTAKTGQPSKPARQNSKSTRSAADITAQSVAAMTTADVKVAAEPEHMQLRRSGRQSIKLTRPAGKATARGDASAQHTTVAPTKASMQTNKVTASRVLSMTKTGASKQPRAKIDAAQLKGQTKPASTKVTQSKTFSSTQGQTSPGVPAAKTVASPASSSAQPARVRAASCKAAMPAAVAQPVQQQGQVEEHQHPDRLPKASPVYLSCTVAD